MATVVLPRSVPYAGSTLTAAANTGGWAGAVVVQPANDDNNASPYISTLSLSQAFLCPQRTCPWTVTGPRDWRSTDTKQWLKGAVRVVLFGSPGSTVTVRFVAAAAQGAPVRVSATQAPLEYLATATSGSGQPQHQHVREFHRMGRGGSWQALSTVVAYVVRPAGAIVESHCITSGGNQMLDSVGGSTPCFDHSGFDWIGGPNAYPTTPMTGVVPVGTYQYGISGNARIDAAIGSDATITGIETQLHVVTMGVRVE